MADPNLKAHLSSSGVMPESMTPPEFGKLIASESQKWAKVVKFDGIQLI